MRTGDVLAALTSALFGGITGWLIGGGIGAVIGTTVFGGLAIVGARANIRPAIVATVLVGTMTGALIGSSIVEAICLPATCAALEITGGLVSAVIAFIGVGLVAALVTRSFDEYNERADAGLPPTGVGCETDERE
ncbi:MAG: hypothetical protein M3112_10210 [Actinomycetia bacterium]|nr:hypothetical protein [Actinomycetes bacterium]